MLELKVIKAKGASWIHPNWHRVVNFQKDMRKETGIRTFQPTSQIKAGSCKQFWKFKTVENIVHNERNLLTCVLWFIKTYLRKHPIDCWRDVTCFNTEIRLLKDVSWTTMPWLPSWDWKCLLNPWEPSWLMLPWEWISYERWFQQQHLVIFTLQSCKEMISAINGLPACGILL